VQQKSHHLRIKRRLPEPPHIAAGDFPEIEALPRQIDDKLGQMAFWHGVLHTRWQKQRPIDVPGAKYSLMAQVESDWHAIALRLFGQAPRVSGALGPVGLFDWSAGDNVASASQNAFA